MHPLFRKKALDAVNEALLSPSDYPGTDKDYNHPFWFKGTEPEGIKTGAQARAHHHVAEIDIHTGPENGGNPNLLGRSLLDEDAKEEIKEEKGGYKRLGAQDTECTGCGGKGEHCALCGRPLAHCECRDNVEICDLCGRKVHATSRLTASKRALSSSPLFSRKTPTSGLFK